ncbi:hypothetical protein HDG36_002667 [Paraburkholderia sp. Kb1A]|uniref:hypothetical protein n=1 Tax=unclassified Paraburkholderia TaxID=2615204 RepID=UPI0016212930|nr:MULTISPECIES: hypothetical protein [unclassified Paraburkholderia]MBB5451127.1 hypothetical protein [Paraburkholderia sp. Kb1A]
MKIFDSLRSRAAGPLWGLVFSLLMTAAGVGLWRYATGMEASGQTDESLAVGAMVVGVFMGVYAGHEIYRSRR